MDRVTAIFDVSLFERDLDAAGYLEQGALIRQAIGLLPDHDDSGRRQNLEELAALNEFLAERNPSLKLERLKRLKRLRAASAEEVPER
ncbi:hypothetical protein [Micromonospora zhanjiangensis]|uniref:Uncharacterized protein n=1 Tax=Micromonospora zhanjiangensis TaxID=1522057 RepID=A0ABV8KWJ3_9ACTN